MTHNKTLYILILFTIFTTSTHAADLLQEGENLNTMWRVENTWNINAKPVDLKYSLDEKLVFILTADNMVQIYNKKGELQGEIPVPKTTIAIDIAPQGEALYLVDGKNKSLTSIALDYVRDINIADAPFKGKADAPVTIVLFTDFECPYCKELEPVLNEVVAANKENVRYVFKHMPLSFHKMAGLAHQAAVAAENQGKFWEFHDQLFALKELNPEAIMNIAKNLVLNMDAFTTDINSPETYQKIAKDLNDADNAMVTGTPTIFVNGRKLQEHSTENLQKMIDTELTRKTKQAVPPKLTD